MKISIDEIIIQMTLNQIIDNNIFISAGAFTLKTKNKTYYFDADTSWINQDNNKVTIHLSNIVDPNTDKNMVFNEDDLQDIIRFEDFYIYFENKNDLKVESINRFEIIYDDIINTERVSININKAILDKCLKEALCYEVIDNLKNQSYIHEGVN